MGLLDDLPVGISYYDADGFLVHFNRCATSFGAGSPSPELTATSYRSACPRLEASPRRMPDVETATWSGLAAWLTSSSSQGAHVESLIRDQLLLGGEEDGRIHYAGPPLALEPQAALHVGMILHELGANARKHCALTVPSGRVSIRWAVRSSEGLRLLLQWQERGGPPVEAPAWCGFGSVVLTKSLAAYWGQVSINYAAQGLTCEIALPLPDVTGSAMTDLSFHFQAADFSASGADAAPTQASVQNARVLVVEDEPLVAMDVASALSDAGCEVVGPAATLEKAAALVEAGGIDAALLDANLAGDPVDSLAADLSRRQVPFAFLTGYGREGVPQEHREAPLLEKPFSSRQLLAVLGQILRRG